MSKIYTSALELIGKTPILEPKRYNAANGIDKAKILVKLEAFNPAGSGKDRIAKAMIEDAEKKGLLKPGSVIIEPTSGNTGIGLAAVAAAKGYRAIFTMPETMSVERRNLIAAYGAEIVLTEGKKGMQGTVDKANELAKEIPNAFIPGQFVNPVNPKAHYETTGPEIFEDTDGAVDIFLAGVGTGGTLSGTGKYIKEKKPSAQVIAIEPADSPLLSEGHAGPHKLQGIGANFVPETLDTKIYDEVFTVTTEQAYSTAQSFTQNEGILIGISGGAALYAASEVAKRPENAGKTITRLTKEAVLWTASFVIRIWNWYGTGDYSLPMSRLATISTPSPKMLGTTTSPALTGASTTTSRKALAQSMILPFGRVAFDTTGSSGSAPWAMRIVDVSMRWGFVNSCCP